MAVWVFKDGDSALIKPKALQAHLDAGWSVEDPEAPKAESEEAPKPKRNTRKKQDSEQE